MDQVLASESVVSAKGTIKLGGVTYLLNPATPRDLGSFTQWVRTTRKPEAESALGGLIGDPAWGKLTPELQARLIDRLPVEKKKKTISPEELGDLAREAMLTAEGCAFLVWLLARDNHPGLKHSDLIKPIEGEGVEYVNYLLQQNGDFKAVEDMMAKESQGAPSEKKPSTTGT